MVCAIVAEQILIWQLQPPRTACGSSFGWTGSILMLQTLADSLLETDRVSCHSSVTVRLGEIFAACKPAWFLLLVFVLEVWIGYTLAKRNFAF